MHPINNKAKTLGTRSANLVVGLYDSGKEIFDILDVCRLTGLPANSARSLIRSLVNRGLVTRLKPGLFHLVPLEFGSEHQFVGNPYVIAEDLIQNKKHYISHASAMDIHGMLTQPQLIVYITTLKARRPLIIHGYEYKLIRSKPEYFFGLTRHWIDKQHTITVSDLERTIIDGLKQPQYCGGFSEVAKGFWIRQEDIKIEKLVKYALRLGISVVSKRLGFMLELFDVQTPLKLIERLQSKATRPYLMLDPLLPNEGKYTSRWKLRLNVDPKEIISSIRT